MAEIRLLFRLYNTGERFLHLFRHFAFAKSQPVGYPDTMRIRYNGRLVINIAKNQIGDFPADARQGEQVLHIVGNTSAEALADDTGKILDILRLYLIDPAGKH